MTRLMKFLFFAALFFSVWLSLITKKINHRVVNENFNFIYYFPVTAVVLFGIYAASVVLWRVYTFNDCKEAALELKKQIKEAQVELKKMGFVFEEEIS